MNIQDLFGSALIPQNENSMVKKKAIIIREKPSKKRFRIKPAKRALILFIKKLGTC